MPEHFYFDSQGQGRLHGCRWRPEGKPNAVVQIVHGIAEYVERYDDFARYLNSQGYLVVAEDHMGHGKSIGDGGIQGYFHKGWFTAVADTYRLLEMTRQEYPDVPYVLLGHSMGSFMTRTILEKYPNSGISAAVICGTGWQPRSLLAAAIPLCRLICRMDGEQNPSPKLQNLVFGSYNRRVDAPKTDFDWLNRDEKAVKAYIADPLCGFTATAGLLRDLLTGLNYTEHPKHLAAMKKELPVFFISGGDDPVGSYGKGVKRAAEAFRKAGMQNVAVKIYPKGRHEILNELNKEAVYADVARWIEQVRG
ncbi:MAG TPA: lysophospholipase [Candidatus Faecousia intestinigallinarum]|nr:lysophospholipase [Candidatus Faecousia intestinigallinarum]